MLNFGPPKRGIQIPGAIDPAERHEPKRSTKRQGTKGETDPRGSLAENDDDRQNRHAAPHDYGGHGRKGVGIMRQTDVGIHERASPPFNLVYPLSGPPARECPGIRRVEITM